MSEKQNLNRIAIIGIGLIGGSIARAARKHNLAKTIAVCDRNEIALASARKEKFVDETTSDPAKAAAGADLVILATPPSMLSELAEKISPALKQGAVVMDTASVKRAAIAAIGKHMHDGVEFIPAHPIAGSEHSGLAASSAELFKGRQIIVTPDEPLPTPGLQMVTTFWRGMGARIEAMPPHLHDMLYAYVSHLPQLLSRAALPVVGTYREEKPVQKFLRVSGSNTPLWMEIFVLNKDNVLKALDRYLDVMSHILKELKAAPEPGRDDERSSRSVLFPRIAASCLVTTAMEAEKLAGFPFARYAGTGFADFTEPATSAPDGDIENISGQHADVARALEEYVAKLKACREMLDKEDTKALAAALR